MPSTSNLGTKPLYAQKVDIHHWFYIWNTYFGPITLHDYELAFNLIRLQRLFSLITFEYLPIKLEPK